MTVGQQGGMILPVGPGIGPTHVANVTRSPRRAAGRLHIITVIDPIATIPGPPGTQLGMMQGSVWLVTVAAGRLPIKTMGWQFSMIMIGMGGCGMGVGTGPGGWMGAWQCGLSCITLSVIRAAGGTEFS